MSCIIPIAARPEKNELFRVKWSDYVPTHNKDGKYQPVGRLLHDGTIQTLNSHMVYATYQAGSHHALRGARAVIVEYLLYLRTYIFTPDGKIPSDSFTPDCGEPVDPKDAPLVIDVWPQGSAFEGQRVTHGGMIDVDRCERFVGRPGDLELLIAELRRTPTHYAQVCAHSIYLALAEWNLKYITLDDLPY